MDKKEKSNKKKKPEKIVTKCVLENLSLFPISGNDIMVTGFCYENDEETSTVFMSAATITFENPLPPDTTMITTNRDFIPPKFRKDQKLLYKNNEVTVLGRNPHKENIYKLSTGEYVHESALTYIIPKQKISDDE